MESHKGGTVSQETIAQRRLLSLVLTFALGLAPLLLRFPYWSQTASWIARDGLELMGLCLGGASIGLALWQWYVLKTKPGPQGLTRATVTASWIPIALYAAVGTVLVVADFNRIPQGLGLGLAFLGIAVSFRLFQLDFSDKL